MSECECGCGGQAGNRFINGHNKRRTPNDYVEEDRGHETPCWIWQRAVNNKGYGICRRPGSPGTTAHRWYYEQEFGKLPSGVEVDHLCRVRTCVRPSHMEPVSPAVNRQRGLNAKLTPAAVRQIRNSPLGHRALAAQLGVNERTVQDVRSGARWSNVV